MEFRIDAGLLQRAATMRPIAYHCDGYNQASHTNPNSFTFDNYSQASYAKPISLTFDHSNNVSATKPTGVLDIRSSDQWKACFDASLKSNKLMVIEFTAIWCGPCKRMEPMVEELAARYANVEFIKIDVDRLMKVAKEFEVSTMPCFALVKKGMEVDRVLGVKPAELQNKIEEHRASSFSY